MSLLFLLAHAGTLSAPRRRYPPLWRQLVDPLLVVAAIAAVVSLLGYYLAAGID